jgi:hypothetical protein
VRPAPLHQELYQSQLRPLGKRSTANQTMFYASMRMLQTLLQTISAGVSAMLAKQKPGPSGTEQSPDAPPIVQRRPRKRAMVLRTAYGTCRRRGEIRRADVSTLTHTEFNATRVDVSRYMPLAVCTGPFHDTEAPDLGVLFSGCFSGREALFWDTIAVRHHMYSFGPTRPNRTAQDTGIKTLKTRLWSA